VWLVAALTLVIGLAALGTAYAAGSSGGAGQNRGTGSTGPLNVGSTTQGMPPTAQVLYAVVNADGTLARGFPKGKVTSSLSSSCSVTGTCYEVDFNTSSTIANCAFTGTAGVTSSVGTTTGYITVAGSNANTHGVFVVTFDGAGSQSGRPFHLVVTC